MACEFFFSYFSVSGFGIFIQRGLECLLRESGKKKKNEITRNEIKYHTTPYNENHEE